MKGWRKACLRGRYRIDFVRVSFLIAVVIPLTAAAQPLEGDSFVRLVRDARGEPSALETATTSLVASSGPAKGVSVDLFAAVHVAEPSYYQHLNSEFKKYDAVLYELIAPEEKNLARRIKEQKSSVSVFQEAIKDLLQLEFQLDAVDYSAPNFVHADLSPEAFMKSMSDRGDSIWTLLGRVLMQGLLEDQKDPNPIEELKFVMALLNTEDANRCYKLRRYLAQNMSKMDELVAQLEGADGSTLIADRNAKAVQVFGAQLAAGKKKMAIFYGGAHMPDLVRRLEKQYGLKPVRTQWVRAWTLQPPQESAAAVQ
jgi:hypothetical protein